MCAKSLVLPKLTNSHWLNFWDHQNYEKYKLLEMKIEIKRKIDCRWSGAHFVFSKTLMHMIWTEIYNTERKCIQVSVFQINFKVEKLKIRQGNLHKVEKYMKMKTKPTSLNVYSQDINNRDRESVHNLGDVCICITLNLDI